VQTAPLYAHRAECEIEEIKTQLGFQSFDLLREGWLCHAEALGRARKVQFLGNGEEVA
jgi:hypothetical protein